MTRTRSRLLPAFVAASGIAIGCVHAPPRELPAPRAPASPQVEVGQRVRVRWGILTYIGTITALSADRMSIATAGRQSVAVPLEDVEELEVSRGRRESHRVLGGVLKGAWIGAAAGFLLALPGSVDCTGWACGLGVIVVPPIGAVIGATIGGISRTFSHPEVWERVPLDSLRGPTAAR